MLVFKPHQALVYRATTPNSNDYASNGNTVYGLLTPTDNASFYQSWGIDVKVAGTYCTNLGEDIETGDHLLLDGAYWEVVGLPRKYTAIFYLQYAEYPLSLCGEDQ